MARELTKRQESIYNFIRSTILEHGYPPTFREIGEEFGIQSTNGVMVTLNALEKKGYIRRHRKLSRGLELTESVTAGNTRQIPVIGRVAAGQPIVAEQNLEGMISLDNLYFRTDGVFALRVRGDSMKNAGIHNRDIVFVQHQQKAEQGEIVVAIIGDDATVKRYFPEGSRVRLEPENEAYRTIIVEEGDPDFRLAGKVIGLMRQMQ